MTTDKLQMKRMPKRPASVPVPMATPTPPGVNGQGASVSRGNAPNRYSPPAENMLPDGARHTR